MAKKAKVKKDWSKTNGSKLATAVIGVGEAMQDNPDFKTPAVVPTDMVTQGGKMNTAYNNRKNGLVAKEIYKTTLADTNEMMTTQADYVSRLADGNMAIIASATYTPTATTINKSIIPLSPQPPVLENVNGELSIKLSRVKGASSYCYVIFIGELKNASVLNNQINIELQANMIIVPAGTTHEYVRGLASQTKVWVMALAQNSAGKSAFSPAVSIGIA